MKVGDKLLLVYFRRRGETLDVTLSKVGRKWAYIDENPRYRIALEGNDDYRPGTVYDGDHAFATIWESREEYEAAQRVRQMRDDFTERVRNGMLPLDADKLRRAWSILWGRKELSQ